MTAVRTLRVLVKTANVDKAGTNDPVLFDIGKTRWFLANPRKDDFERGHEDAFDLPPTASLQDTDFWRILICKGPDGSYGGWLLDGVSVLVNGANLYQRQHIGRWLQNEGSREWLAPDFTELGTVPRSIDVPETTVREQFQSLLSQLSLAELKPTGSLTVAVEYSDIYVKQKFEADIRGPNPDITMIVRFLPVVREGKIEVVVKNITVDVEYPLWFEAASGFIVAELIERHIEGELKSQLKSKLKAVLQAQIDRAIPTGLAKQVSLRQNKVEIFI